jgi:hypothetical protein
MIHDIDVIFKCSKIKSENISASGVSVISDTPTLPMPVLNLKTVVWQI